MNGMLMQSWWIPAIRGVVAITFGILALAIPAITLLSLVILFAAYALVGGAVSVFGAITCRKDGREWWLPLLLGVVSLGAGMIALVYPGLTALVLVLLIGANALVTGVIDFVVAIRMRKSIQREWLLMLNAAASILFGILVFVYPDAGALALIWLISFYAVFSGVVLLALAYRLRAKTSSTRPSGDIERRSSSDRRGSSAHS